MRDFTIQMYLKLLDALKKENYKFVTMVKFIENEIWNTEEKICVLRHDIDKKIDNAVAMAKLERDRGIKATYYVRFIDDVYDVNKLKKIEAYGHEIGYHYETLDKCKGNVDKAYELFKEELEKIRENFEIKTICMHGYPLNPWRNLDIWKKYDYHKLGIIGEPYLDVDYSKVAYFTDTGRSWSSKARVKDVIPPNNYNEKHGLHARTTPELINLLNTHTPQKIIILAHPNRWALGFSEWMIELLSQKMKNIGKLFLAKRR